MKSLHKYIFIAAVLLIVASTQGTRAQELFGAGFIEFFEEGETLVRKEVPSALYSINPNSGATTFVGDIGFPDCTGLGFHPLTKVLYAVCFDPNLSDSVLLIVNTETGEGELVGPLNLQEGLVIVDDISFRSDGVLFAVVSGKVLNQTGIIDTQTGNFTPLGSPGFNGFSEGGLGFSPLDILFYAGFGTADRNDLFIINQQNGSADFDKVLVFADRSQEQAIQSLDTNLRSGVLFAAYAPFQDDNVILGTIDTESGIIRDVGPTSGIFIRAIAFRSNNIEIPTLSEYGLIATAIVLFGVATVFLICRRSSSAA